MNRQNEEPRFICPFPDCGKVFWKAPGKPDCCPGHRQLIKDVVFITSHLQKVKPPVAESPDKPGPTVSEPDNAAVLAAMGQRKLP
jgi:hypothetical protein